MTCQLRRERDGALSRFVEEGRKGTFHVLLPIASGTGRLLWTFSVVLAEAK